MFEKLKKFKQFNKEEIDKGMKNPKEDVYKHLKEAIRGCPSNSLIISIDNGDFGNERT